MDRQGLDLVDNIFDALDIAKKAHALLPQLLPPNMKAVHFRILHAIYRTRDDTGSSRVSDISKSMGILLPNTTKFINELVVLGVVEKLVPTSDKRVVLVHTTELGEQYIRKYLLDYHILLQQQFSQLGEANCNCMIETINKVYEAMKKIYQGEN